MKIMHGTLNKILAIILVALMGITMTPATAYSMENGVAKSEYPYGIEIIKGNVTSIQQVDAEATDLTDLKSAAIDRVMGVSSGDPTTSGGFPAQVFGTLDQPFTLTSSDKVVSFKIQKPEISQDGFWEKLIEEYWISVQSEDADGNAVVAFYPMKSVDNNQLETTISMGASDTVTCALVGSTIPDTHTETSEVTFDSSIRENSDGQTLTYSWKHQLSKTGANIYSGHALGVYTAEIVLDLSDGMELDKASVRLTSEKFPFELDNNLIESKGNGQWIIPLKLASDLSTPNMPADAMNDAIELTFNVNVSGDEFIPNTSNLVSSELIIRRYNSLITDPAAEVGTCYDEKAVATATMTSAVTITPADLTIYEGGTNGYEEVVTDDENGTTSNATGLPYPLFKITAPNGSNLSATDLTFTNKDSLGTGDTAEKDVRYWKAVQEGNSEYYHFEPVNESGEVIEGEGASQVRVVYKDGEGNPFEKNELPTLTDDTFETYSIHLYSGPNDENFSNVTALAGDDKDYPLSVNTGTLTVRAVEEENPVSPVKEAAPENKLEAGTAVATIPDGATYKLNGEVPIDTTNNTIAPSLLFDNIIASDGKGEERITKLQAHADSYLDDQKLLSEGDRNYEIKFLDLVDANNGNAWISSSAGVDIYWAYPAGVTSENDIQVIHFEGLHRDTSEGASTGFDPADISSSKIETMQIEKEENYIKFHVTEGDFSPYAVVWTAITEEPEPDNPPVGPVGPVVPPTPELERGDHYAYIVGYEDDTIRPQNNITRAEVATIFFRLLTDESREAYFTTDCDFTDVNGGAWYANTVATLSNAGILAGYPDGSFRPNDPITRAEFAAIATRFDDLAAADSTFTDIDGHWAEDAINAAYGAGWVGGYPDGTFRPNNNITRAEVMSLVNRVLDREVDEDGMLDDMLTWIDNEPGTWYYEAVQEATNSHDYERKDADSVETWTQINEPIDWDKVESDLLN